MFFFYEMALWWYTVKIVLCLIYLNVFARTSAVDPFVFLGLLGPNPDLLVRRTDPTPDPQGRKLRDPEPEPLVRGTDPRIRIRIRTKMSLVRTIVRRMETVRQVILER
jgi:hypothetical protein